MTIALVAGSGLLVYGLERDVDGSNITGIGDSLWWAVVTTTTGGYGDHFPVTPEGRATAVVVMLVGIGLVGVITANVAAYFVEPLRLDRHDAAWASRTNLTVGAGAHCCLGVHLARRELIAVVRRCSRASKVCVSLRAIRSRRQPGSCSVGRASEVWVEFDRVGP